MNLLKIFFCILLITLAKSQETVQEELEEEREKYEYIEEFDNETYLLYISENDRNYLDLLNLEKSFKADDMSDDMNVYFFCPKEFYKSLSMSSYYMPVQKPAVVNECPKMKETCCSVSDIDRLKTQWNEKYKKYLVYQYQYFRYYIIQIMSHHEKIRQAALNVVKHDGSEPMCKKIAQQITEVKFTKKDLNDLKSKISKLIKFDINTKQNFICFLCDFHTLKNIDFNNKIVKMNYKICEKVVDETFDIFYYFNTFLYRYLNNINYLTYCFDIKDHSLLGKFVNEEENLPTYIDINNSLSIEQCKQAKQFKLNILANCFQYCQTYDIWYYKNHYFKDIFKLQSIFDNVNNKIFQNQIKFKITKPKTLSSFLPLFEFKYNKYNVFDYFQYIYVEDDGLQPEFLFQANNK